MSQVKTPPNDLEIEKAVLGAALIDSSGVGEMVETLRKVNVFYDAKNAEIYEAIIELYEVSAPVDLLTVSDKLKSKERLDMIGGSIYLVELTQTVSSSAHIEYHCRILMQLFVKRKTITMGIRLQNMSYNADSDIFDSLDNAQSMLDSTAEWLMKKKPSNLKQVVDEFFSKAENKKSGIPSGIQTLQEKLNGYQSPNLIVLAARPGMGKTALMLSEALSMAKKGFPVGIFSLEMGDTELVARMLSNETGISNERLALNKINDNEAVKLVGIRETFSDLPIYIQDQSGISPLELKIQAAKWKRDHDIKMIFVDYLQLMRNPIKGGNREQEVSDISSRLKGLAKELGIPVMALSQLNRSVETRGGNKRPLLSDLRESGAIEQDADLVMFLYRPEYYGIDEWDDEERTPTAGQAEISIAKFRNGKTGFCRVGTNLKYMRFFDLTENNLEDYGIMDVKPNYDLSNAFPEDNTPF